MKKKILGLLSLLLVIFALSACGGEKPDTDNPSDKNPEHTCVFTNYVSNNDATLTEDGTKTAICDICGAEDTIADEGSMLVVSTGLEFTLNEDKESYSVTGIGTCVNTNVVIPDTHDNKPVTKIGNGAFIGRENLTRIVVPDTVTSIGDIAFYGCEGLTSINIPEGVTSIGDSAFASCSSLTSITVDENNEVYHASGNCLIETATKTLIVGCKTSVIPDDGSVTIIGCEAFSGCSSLTSITIPESVTSIGDSAFRGCDSLKYNEYYNAYYLGNDDNPYVLLVKAKDTSITSCEINSNTKFIHSSAFSDCYSLINITIPDSVTSIGWHAFSDCSSLTSITIPEGVTSISYRAFSRCSSLTSITIPESVTIIDKYAFWCCSKLTSIDVPDTVTSIGFNAFEYCTDLTRINFAGTTDEWLAISKGDGWDFLTAEYTVYCTDGTVAKDGTVTKK